MLNMQNKTKKPTYFPILTSDLVKQKLNYLLKQNP